MELQHVAADQQHANPDNPDGRIVFGFDDCGVSPLDDTTIPIASERFANRSLNVCLEVIEK